MRYDTLAAVECAPNRRELPVGGLEVLPPPSGVFNFAVSLSLQPVGLFVGDSMRRGQYHTASPTEDARILRLNVGKRFDTRAGEPEHQDAAPAGVRICDANFRA